MLIAAMSAHDIKNVIVGVCTSRQWVVDGLLMATEQRLARRTMTDMPTFAVQGAGTAIVYYAIAYSHGYYVAHVSTGTGSDAIKKLFNFL